MKRRLQEALRHGGIASRFLVNWFSRAVHRVQHGLGERGPKSRATGEPVCGYDRISEQELREGLSDECVCVGGVVAGWVWHGLDGSIYHVDKGLHSLRVGWIGEPSDQLVQLAVPCILVRRRIERQPLAACIGSRGSADTHFAVECPI